MSKDKSKPESELTRLEKAAGEASRVLDEHRRARWDAEDAYWSGNGKKR